MDKKINNVWLIIMPRYVLIVFFLLNLLAMLFYSGGTYHDHSSLNYSFTYNFLSDLGRTFSFGGKLNFISSQLFNSSLILAGAIYSFFYFHVQSTFNIKYQKLIAILGSCFGMLAGFSLIGVGLTPADLYLDLHILFAHWLFRFMFIASFIYTILIFLNPLFENKYAIGYLIFTITILIYIIISELGPSPKVSHQALQLQVVSQKMILFVFMVAVYIQTLGINKLYK